MKSQQHHDEEVCLGFFRGSLLNFQSRDKKIKISVYKIVDRVFSGAKTSEQKSNVKIIWLSNKRSITPLLHASRFSK